MDPRERDSRRESMIQHQLLLRGIRDDRVLAAMRAVPREAFVPDDLTAAAYDDRALCVGMGQTISQPYIVAWMTQALDPRPDHRVLEIGTGTGYQTALLAMMADHVFTIERIKPLSDGARDRLSRFGLVNISFRVGDGTMGWPDAAPFDRIIVTAAAPDVVRPLSEQLVEGGRMVIPVGDEAGQQLTVVERHRGRTVERPSMAVRFVKLIGESGFHED